MKFENIEIENLDPNPKNPRGIDIVEEDEKLSLLKDSIARFGILVPLVAKHQKGRFQLIDGERRYWAAKELGLKKVPAYIFPPDLDERDILQRMFHIHHN